MTKLKSWMRRISSQWAGGKVHSLDIPSSKVWHRCRSKPPNCCLARAARVVCAQPGTVVCSQTPVVSCLSERGGGGGGEWWSVYVDSKVIA